MNDFALARVSLAREEGSGGSRSAVEFFDFIVDGASLRDQLRTPNIGVLSDKCPSVEFARRLVQEDADPLLDGLSAIYGCRECLDTLCGGQATTVEIVGDRVHWSEIQAYSIDLSVDDPTKQLNLRATRVGPFEFDRAQYEGAIEPFLSSRA